MAMPIRKKKDMPMPPPGPPKSVIAIGIGKPKPGGDEPSDPMGKDNMPSDVPPPDPSAAPSGAGGAASGDDMGDGKVAPEKALVITADKHCKDCKNYDPMTGDCSKVSGSFQPEDGCYVFYESMGDEPDSDDMGGPSDNDADDMPTAQGAMNQ